MVVVVGPSRGCMSSWRSCWRREVVTMVEAGAPMAVSASEVLVGHGMTVIHQAAVVTIVYDQVPCTCSPYQWAVEVVTADIAVVLPLSKHHLEVAVANIPPGAEQVVLGVYVEKIVEVDFIHSLILCIGEVQLICHLVAEEQGFVACGVIWHCLGRDGYRHHHCHEHYLFHILSFFVIGIIAFSAAKVR